MPRRLETTAVTSAALALALVLAACSSVSCPDLVGDSAASYCAGAGVFILENCTK